MTVNVGHTRYFLQQEIESTHRNPRHGQKQVTMPWVIIYQNLRHGYNYLGAELNGSVPMLKENEHTEQVLLIKYLC